jgi:hypothetical protein
MPKCTPIQYNNKNKTCYYSKVCIYRTRKNLLNEHKERKEIGLKGNPERLKGRKSFPATGYIPPPSTKNKNSSYSMTKIQREK